MTIAAAVGYVALVALACLIVWCAAQFTSLGDTAAERNDREPAPLGPCVTDGTCGNVGTEEDEPMKKVKPYMPEPGGAVPFKNPATPTNARSNAANKLPRKAKHSKPRGMA